MSLPESTIRRLGDELFAALRGQYVLEPFSISGLGATIADAYRVSLRLLEHRRMEGERVIGKKIGVTSRAVQDMLGVHQPDFGFLMDTMQIPYGETVGMSRRKLIQPRAEGEIAFILKKELRGPGITQKHVLDSTEYVSPCFEIVDSRIRDWKIAIEDTVADNASCGVFVLGPERALPFKVDLAGVRMHICKNGTLSTSGLGSAVQGHPAAAVAWLANTLGDFGVSLGVGEIVLSGSLGALLPALPGDRFELQLTGIGHASIAFTR